MPWPLVHACIALDQEPPPRWPTPLAEYTNFLNLDVPTLQSPVASCDRYAEIPTKLEEWLGRDEGLMAVMTANGEYFDRFVDPERVGEHILATSVV